jgi:acyl dehydratase
MAVRGEYNDLEKEILEDFEKEADTRQGWHRPPMDAPPMMRGNPFITTELLKEYASGLDPWNPFWNLDEYAVATRWGSLIAHPFYLERLKPRESMLKTRKGLFLTFYLVGHDYEYYQPIRPGDTIRTWELRPTLEDSTDLSGDGPRKFRYVDGQCDYVNQRDEIIGALRQYVEVTLHEGDPPVDKYFDDYGYTQKELDYLTEVFEDEKPRGAEIRYWEDVEVGDDMGTITDGPTSFLHMGFGPPPPPPGQVPKRTFTRYEEPLGGPVMMGYVPDRETGLLYPVHGGRHGYDRAAQFEGGPRAWIYNVQSRYPMCRLITNWTGDDGFVCKFGWRHIWRTPVGDALLINGKVLKKYVEDGDHLVDLSVWCLNLRGTITDMALATVKLISKEDKYPDVEKVVKR